MLNIDMNKVTDFFNHSRKHLTINEFELRFGLVA